jgi:hypothetical protein
VRVWRRRSAAPSSHRITELPMEYSPALCPSMNGAFATLASPRKRWRPPQGHPHRPHGLLRPHPPMLDIGGLRLTRATLAVPTTSFAPSAYACRRRPPPDPPFSRRGTDNQVTCRPPPALAAAGLHLRSSPVLESSPPTFGENVAIWPRGELNRDPSLPGLRCP